MTLLPWSAHFDKFVCINAINCAYFVRAINIIHHLSLNIWECVRMSTWEPSTFANMYYEIGVFRAYFMNVVAPSRNFAKKYIWMTCMDRFVRQKGWTFYSSWLHIQDIEEKVVKLYNHSIQIFGLVFFQPLNIRYLRFLVNLEIRKDSWNVYRKKNRIHEWTDKN